MTFYYPLLLAIVWASVLLVPPTGAQEPPDEPAATPPAATPPAETPPAATPPAATPPAVAPSDSGSALTLESVEASLAAIEGNSAIEDAVKDLLRPKYEEAIQSLKDSAENAAKANAYRESITTAPAETASPLASTNCLTMRELKFKRLGVEFPTSYPLIVSKLPEFSWILDGC